MNSVVSAAIIEGNLIIGLSDGSIINCGFVQGPQGLSGPQGPMGATGDNGTDGNTILTVAGTPGNEMGRDGDYAIDNINWRIYGPKSGGVWGKAKEMLPGPENILENGRAPSGSGGGSMGGSGNSGGGGGIVYTNTVQLTNPVTTLLSSTANYKIIPNAPAGTTNQEGANLWGFGSCFDNFDAAIPVATGALPPTPLPGFADNWDGRLWFDSNEDELTLYIYNNGAWIPAAPPVSLDGINATIDAALVVQNDLLDRVTAGETTQTALQGTVNTALTTQQQILTELGDLETEATDLQNQIDDLSVTKGKVARYTVDNNSGTPVSRNGDFATNTDLSSNVTLMSFGIEDADGALTKPMADGDIIETVNPTDGKVNRYRVADSTGAPTMVLVEYVSGDDLYDIGAEKQFYIYPQNEAGVSKEYVDAQDDLRLLKAGDEMSGRLTVKPTSGNYGLVVLPGPDASGTTDIFRVRDYANNQVFYADVSGGVGVGNSWTPTSNNHLIPKKYLEDYVATHGGGGSANVPVQPGAPGGMVVGDMWFDTNTNSLMIKVT